jgi:hypothetical protein
MRLNLSSVWGRARSDNEVRLSLCLIVASLVLFLPSSGYAALPLKPCRVLVLADARARDGHVWRDAGELGDAVALLSLWGIPHDVLRLDTQALREEDLVGPSGQPTYGVILWAVRTDLLARQFLEDGVLRDACLKHHISLIAFGDRIDVPAVQEILGLRSLGRRECVPPLAAGDPAHFIMRDESPLPRLAEEPWCSGGLVVKPTDPEVSVLLRAGVQPMVTARTLDAGSGTRAVWLGGDANSLLCIGSDLGIHLFQRALVWSLGAVVVHDYDNTLLLRMDDPGAAQSSCLRGWNYPSLSESLIQQKILAPLREHHARLDVFCCPGYVDVKTHSILHAEQVDRIDTFGDREDIRDMFTALLEGQKQGLVEIESHGWTHMSPDLDTPIPGSTSWWAGDVATEWFQYRWYREFYDKRRNRDVPPEIQLQHMRTSCDWLQGYFGSRPLVFCPPGHAISGDSWVYPKDMSGTLEVRLEGLEPKACYRLFSGDDNNSALLGEFQADAAGTINTTLPAPPDLWLDTRGYFTINQIGGRTQFIAGPIREALGFDFALDVRDRPRMSVVEQGQFAGAGESLHQGRLMGHLDTRAYRPPSRSPAYTYQAAGKAGFGLAIDTACHEIDGQNVTTLEMIPVISSPKGVEPAIASRSEVPVVFRFHDRDLAVNPDFLVLVLKSISAQGPAPTYLSADELTGYLHASWTVRPGPENSLVATADFSSPECRYLDDHESSWTLLATDEVLAALRSTSNHIVVREEGGADLTSPDMPGQTEAIHLHVPARKSGHTLTSHAQASEQNHVQIRIVGCG